MWRIFYESRSYLHKGLNNQPTRVREKVMRRSVHDQVGNLFLHCRYHTDAKQKLALRVETFIRGVGKRDGRSDAGASRRLN
jgi:RPA family protein